jgi:hypothetical protein
MILVWLAMARCGDVVHSSSAQSSAASAATGRSMISLSELAVG